MSDEEKELLPIIADTPSPKLPAIVQDEGLYRYIQKVNSYPSLSPEEEFMIAKEYFEQQSLDSAQKLILSHLKLVAKIALSYKTYGFSTSELISEGNIGLMHAVRKFNPHLGARLSTYAMWWIKASISDYILKSWSLVKIGTNATQKKLFFSLSKIKNKIRNLHSREINSSDYKLIAEELGVDESEVINMDVRMAGSDLSLNNPVSEEDDSEMIDFLPESRPSQEDILLKNEDKILKKQLLLEAMSELSEREIIIINERRLSEKPSTLDDLSQKFNISRERIRQIETKAFEKIQKFILTKLNNQ